MEFPYDPDILLLGIYLKKPETPTRKNICTPLFIAALFTMAKIQKQPKFPSVDEWIKSCGTFTQWNTTQPLKGKEILLIVTAWMDLESIMQSEISQSEKDKYHMISLIYGI